MISTKPKIILILYGIIFVSILGTLFHFLYAWSDYNSFLALFCATNESIWEHMKLFFFPMLFYTIFVTFQYPPKSPQLTAMYLALLTGTCLIPTLFYTYSGILGYHLSFIDIAIFYLSVLLFFCFTFHPPALGIFTAP